MEIVDIKNHVLCGIMRVMQYNIGEIRYFVGKIEHEILLTI